MGGVGVVFLLKKIRPISNNAIAPQPKYGAMARV
jgi:hypothetical protein